MSKAESRFALVETPFSLQQIVDDVVATFETAAREKTLELRSRSIATVPEQLLGDPVAMRQVLTNLVGNAVKFTERGTVDADGHDQRTQRATRLRCRST